MIGLRGTSGIRSYAKGASWSLGSVVPTGVVFAACGCEGWLGSISPGSADEAAEESSISAALPTASIALVDYTPLSGGLTWAAHVVVVRTTARPGSVL